MSNEIATLDTFSDFNNLDNIGENLELPVVKCKASVQMFELPDGSKVDDVQGYILKFQRYVVLWHHKDAERPAARSDDGIHWTKTDDVLLDEAGIDDVKEGGLVAESSVYQWDSHPEGGNRKWSTERVKIFFLRPDKKLPCVVDVSATGLKDFQKYMVGLEDAGLKAPLVNTKISLDKVEKGSNTFSKWVFTNEGVVTEREEALKIKAIFDQCKSHMSDYTKNEDSLGKTDDII